MADTTMSPNMGLIVPTVGVDPGPDWANNVNADLGILDQHNHSTGQGVRINPSGILINTDLPMNSQNLTEVNTINYNALSGSLSGVAPNLGCTYVAGNELYYNDEAGNVVQITNNGSVNAGAGSITGLPSGTASVSFSAGTYVFQSATNTAGNLDGGSVTIRETVASAKGVKISSPTSLAADYEVFMPAALPAGNTFMTLSSGGNIGASVALPLTGANIAAATVTGSNIASATITGSNIANATITSNKLVANNYATSGSSGSVSLGTSGSFTPIVQLSVTLVTTGRSVMVKMQSPYASSGLQGALGIGGNGISIALYRDADQVFVENISLSSVYPPCGFTWILYNVTANTHVFSIQYTSTGPWSVTNVELVAIEIF